MELLSKYVVSVVSISSAYNIFSVLWLYQASPHQKSRNVHTAEDWKERGILSLWLEKAKNS
jgi:hypothetical protein